MGEKPTQDQATALLYIYTESSLHAGVGFVEDAPVDLPIQREVTTAYPLIFASSLKGSLRAHLQDIVQEEEITAAFGPQPEAAEDTPQSADEAEEKPTLTAALRIGDARLLIFPVRSLLGIYAWITSADVLARFHRDVQWRDLDIQMPVLEAPPEGSAYTAGNSHVVTEDGRLVLEEFTFKTQEHEAMAAIGEWFANVVLPQDDAYAYWRRKVQTDLVVLPEDAYRFFVTTRTEVQHRIRINPETGTAAPGALWTEENLPADAVLYAPVVACPPQSPMAHVHSAQEVLQWLQMHLGSHLQIGGNRTLGRGLVRVHWHGEANP
jgi:CRISPR-associated protein Cmr4